MAFLGSFGKALGISTPEAVNVATSFFQGGPTQAVMTALGSLGTPQQATAQQPVDVSAPPAGVDSPATLTPLSQTSGFPQHGFMPPRAPMPRPSPIINASAMIPMGVPGMVGQAARSFARSPGGSALIGGGAALLPDFVTDMFGNTKKLVITRKLQREVKKVFMMSGGDIGFVAMNSLMLFGKDLNEDQVLAILFKTFKNQGPFVTKAAVRKTRSTIRKMETLCDLKDRLCPPKRPAARRKPAARSTTITNVR